MGTVVSLAEYRHESAAERYVRAKREHRWEDAKRAMLSSDPERAMEFWDQVDALENRS